MSLDAVLVHSRIDGRGLNRVMNHLVWLRMRLLLILYSALATVISAWFICESDIEIELVPDLVLTIGGMIPAMVIVGINFLGSIACIRSSAERRALADTPISYLFNQERIPQITLGSTVHLRWDQFIRI